MLKIWISYFSAAKNGCNFGSYFEQIFSSIRVQIYNILTLITDKTCVFIENFKYKILIFILSMQISIVITSELLNQFESNKIKIQTDIVLP